MMSFRNPAVAVLLALGFAAAQPAEAATPETAEHDAIIAMMADYAASLNAADPERSVDLYADDAVLLAPGGQSRVGKAAIRAAYEQGSKQFVLHVRFSIAEILQAGPGWAIVRSTSAGTMELKPAGTLLPEANQELFILRKDVAGAWKIARYRFSTTAP